MKNEIVIEYYKKKQRETTHSGKDERFREALIELLGELVNELKDKKKMYFVNEDNISQTKGGKEYKYTCPDCDTEHNEGHHPPYCQSCISEVTL